jgi:hypothetical protein
MFTIFFSSEKLAFLDSLPKSQNMDSYYFCNTVLEEVKAAGNSDGILPLFLALFISYLECTASSSTENGEPGNFLFAKSNKCLDRKQVHPLLLV